MKNNIITPKKALQILKDTSADKRNTERYQNALNLAIDALSAKVNPPAYWIFSGDEDDYDGYYINCSHCGNQRKAYDRNNELDVPLTCPVCCSAMDIYNHAHGVKQKNKAFTVYISAKRRNIRTPFIKTVVAKNEAEAGQLALVEVATKCLGMSEPDGNLEIESIVEV